MVLRVRRYAFAGRSSRHNITSVSAFCPDVYTFHHPGTAPLLPSGPDDVVGPEGMEKFCEDIGVEPENVSVYFFSSSICSPSQTDAVEHLSRSSLSAPLYSNTSVTTLLIEWLVMTRRKSLAIMVILRQPVEVHITASPYA